MATPSAAKDLGRLRRITMQLAGRLEKMIPSTKKKDPPAPKEELPPEYERLLGRNDGVVDGINTLGQLVIRLIDKERESCDSPEAASVSVPKATYAELDRRLVAELDRIAQQRRANGAGAQAD
jgi:orotate phosphoribosyltransferase-like protein